MGLGADPIRPADPGVVAQLEAPEATSADPVPDEEPVPLPARTSSALSRDALPLTKNVSKPASLPAAASSPELATSASAASESQDAATPGNNVPQSDPGTQSFSPAASGGGDGGDESGGGESSMSYLSNPSPSYPFLSRLAGEEGMVLLRVQLDTSGLPLRVELAQSSGHARLDGSALSTVWRWKFRAARRAGHSVRGWVQVPIRFSLKGT